SHCYAFVLSAYCDLRNLHSFPTRRSSDLADVRSDPRLSLGGPDALAESARLLARGRPRETGDRQRPPRGRGAVHRFAAGGTGRGDRKSTRLNSSHVKISYAVFCLKKKKIS